MNKLLKIFLLAFMAIVLMGCPKKGVPLIISDACETSYELFYADGRFVFVEDEVNHMRPVNQSKISNFKAWFQQQCPKQYAKTVGGKKKKST